MGVCEREPSGGALDSYTSLIDGACSEVVRWLEGFREGVVVIVPSGCSRGMLLSRLLQRGDKPFSRVYAYRGFKDSLSRLPLAPCTPLNLVEEFGELEELIKRLKAEEGGRVAVVPRSSTEAALIGRALRRGAGVECRLLYLPRLYRRLAGGFGGRVRGLAEVEHSALKAAFRVRGRVSGYSSTLLRHWREEELGELERGKEAILRLSPGRLGLGDYVQEFLRKSALSLATAPVGVLASYGLPVLLALVELLPLAEAGARELAASILGRAGGALTKEAEGFAQRVLEGLSRPRARNVVAAGLAGLVAASREAAPYISREELETIVDQVALEWGLRVDEFKALVENLASFASARLATQQDLEELERRIEERLGEVWREVRELRKELRRARKKLEEEHAQVVLRVSALDVGDVESGGLSGSFKVRRGVPVIKSKEGRARVVASGLFESSIEEVLSRLEKGFVVLEGPKGAGKSVLAAYATWVALHRGVADAVIRVEGLRSGERLPILNYLEQIKGKRFIVFYDPSPVHAYYEPEAVPTYTRYDVRSLVSTLEELARLSGESRRVLVLAVLPGGAYEAIAREDPVLKARLERYVVHVNLRDPVFLGDVVKEYARPRSRKDRSAYEESLRGIKLLAEKIAGFKGGYTLVAKFTGLTLREKGYEVKDAEELLERAGGDAKLFLAYYLWGVLLKGSRDLARRLAVPVLLHAFLGPVPEGVSYLAKAVNPEGYWRFLKPGEVEGRLPSDLSEEVLEPVARWLSAPLEDLVEEMLEEVCGARGEEARRWYSSLGELLEVLDEAARRVVGDVASELGVPADEAGRLFKITLLLFVERRLTPALKSLERTQPERWRRLALIAGSALAAHHPIPLIASKPRLLPGEALEPCELDSYLLVDSVVPPLVVELALLLPSALAHPLAPWHEEAAEELKRLGEKWRSEGLHLLEGIYGLGLALSVAGAAELRKDVETWEAEAALHAAASAVQRVSRKECVSAILRVFKVLGGLAPHYHVPLAAAASELEGLERRAALEVAKAVEGALRHREKLRKWEWSLVEAVHVYSNLLTKHRGYFLGEEEWLRVRMCELLGGLEGQLREIAEVLALRPALLQGLEPCGDVDPAVRAGELLKRLEEMEEEPSRQAVEWAAVLSPKPGEGFKELVRGLRAGLTYLLAMYKMDNDDLEAARELFERAAEIAGELEEWENYLAGYSWSIRCSVLSAGSLEEMASRARAFESLWSEVKEHRGPTIAYLEVEARALTEYLVSLALQEKASEASELLEEERRLLSYLPERGVAVRLFFKLLGVSVKRPEAQEVAAALGGRIRAKLRPAFNTLMGLPVSVPSWCSELKEDERLFCSAVDAVRGDERATAFLKRRFRRELLQSEDSGEHEVVGRFRDDILDFVEKRDASTLVQLWAPADQLARFTLMLWALTGGDEELARAHAKLAAILSPSKLTRRLFCEAAEARGGEELKLALLKLFYTRF
jgi:hypothetical protein